MSVSRFTDENGKLLRGDHFPIRIDRRVPMSPGYAMETHRKSRSPKPRPRTATPTTRTILPPTYMIVDYNEESRHLLPSQFAKSPKGKDLRSDSRIEDFDRPFKPKLKKLTSKPKFLPQALRTSFVLKQKLEVEEDVSTQLFNRKDAEVQTEYDLRRSELTGVKDYQNWTNEVVEPFLKELRKAIKANRPACLEDYIIAFCEARKKREPDPETISDFLQSTINSPSP